MENTAKQLLAPRVLSASILILAAAGMISTANAQFATLHEFAGGYDDGRNPYGGLTPSGSTLYGMTPKGGSNDYGVIFKMNINGNSYTNLHKFIGGAPNGRNPYGSLTLSGSTLFGMTERGGSNDFGVIFKMDTVGSNYIILHKFVGGDNEGRKPSGSLTLSGSTLYGMTYSGGANDYGVVFRMNTDGSNYTNLHTFVGATDDGRNPYGDLTLSGSTLYGITYAGGTNSYGVIFRMDTDGSSYTNLHEFIGGNNDGLSSFGSLTLSGSTLFGMTLQGGSNNNGVIFRMKTDGSSYTNLHKFIGGNDDGRNPFGSLALSGGELYGMTYFGGNSDGGVIFRINTNGSNYINMHDFAGGNGDGKQPLYGALVEVGSYYYGMTSQGGINGNGVGFRQLIPEPTLFLILDFGFWIYYFHRRKFKS